jgi:hypothetical protein
LIDSFKVIGDHIIMQTWTHGWILESSTFFIRDFNGSDSPQNLQFLGIKLFIIYLL